MRVYEAADKGTVGLSGAGVHEGRMGKKFEEGIDARSTGHENMCSEGCMGMMKRGYVDGNTMNRQRG